MSRVSIAAPDLGVAERERVREVIDSGRLADGPVVRDFERAFAAYCGADHGVAAANGTAALHAALAALGVGEGDAVVTTPLSFVASANAIRLCGADPVFADVDPETYALDPDAVERVVRERDDVTAVLAVHLYGLPADLGELARIADEYDLALVEDAAQAHGARVDGAHVGTVGDVGCFSFYPTKNMTTGEGGMVVTDDPALADRAARFVNHGRAEDGTHVSVGHNFRMTSIAAAIGLAQLEKLPAYNETRRANAARLTAALEGIPAVETPVEPADRRHVYHQYTIRCPDRAALRESLDDRGIDAGVYYPRTIPDQPAYDGFDPSVPRARAAVEEVLSLPVHPGLDSEAVSVVAGAVRDHYDRPRTEGLRND